MVSHKKHVCSQKMHLIDMLLNSTMKNNWFLIPEESNTLGCHAGVIQATQLVSWLEDFVVNPTYCNKMGTV